MPLDASQHSSSTEHVQIFEASTLYGLACLHAGIIHGTFDREGPALRATGMRPTPTPPSATWGSTTGLENVDQVRIDG